ncbi:MAG TPA: 6-bladed beta-propeller [Gemmatimonadales bacterium]|nr:6-bladed beta-propeller [Gemmatimonadales bacterium]
MTLRSMITTLFLFSLVPTVAAQTPRPDRSMRGDTTVVTIPAGRLWGPQRAAVEVVRVGGTRDGEPFGMITAVAALPDGGVVIFDAKGVNGAVAWVFDANGQHERRIGRQGAGPGEYRFCSDCLVSNADGSIGFLDHDNRRIMTYDGRGVLRNTAVLSDRIGYGLPPQFLPGPAGSYYARLETTPRPRTPITDPQEYDRFGFVQISEQGTILDTLRPPRSLVAVPARSLLEPRTLWYPLRDGRVAVGASDQLHILLDGPRKSPRSPLLIEGTTRRIPYSSEERAVFRAIWAYSNKYRRGPNSGQSPLPTEPPALKPVFRDFGTDHEGKIFLQLHSTAVRAPASMLEMAPVMREGGGQMPPAPRLEYLEPPLFAAFGPDGTYFGAVLFPVNAVKVSFTAGFAWGLLKDADGQDVLVKYALPDMGRKP